MEWCFKVRLSNVSAKQLNCPGRSPAAMPFFRVNFDGKTLQSEMCPAAGDPSWSYKSSFEYRLVEESLKSCVASLSTRMVSVEIVFADTGSGREVSGGVFSTDLFSVAAGASQISGDLRLASTGAVSGTVGFTLQMEQQGVVSVELQNVVVRGLPRPSSYKLSYHFVSLETHEIEGSIAQPSSDPTWDAAQLPRLLIRTTLRALLQDAIRLYVRDAASGNSRVAHIDLPLLETVQSNTNHVASFKRNAYSNPAAPQSFTALVTGTVMFRDLPQLAQLSSGANVNGSIHGKQLLESCPVPPKYSRAPARLPDAGAFTAASSVVDASLGSHTSAAPGPSGGPQLGQSILRLHAAAPPAAPPAAAHHASAHHQYSPDRSSTFVASIAQPSRVVPRHPIPQAEYAAPSLATPAVPRHPIPQADQASATLNSSYARGGVRSPLASVSDTLVRQHNDTVDAIEAQQRRVAIMAEELNDRTVMERSAHEQRLSDLEREEQRLHNEIRKTDRRIEELKAHREELTIQEAANAKRALAEYNELTITFDELTALGDHLQTLLQSVADHAQEDDRARERARAEVENSRVRLEGDIMQLSEVDSRLRRNVAAPATLPPQPVYITHNGSTTFAAPHHHNSSVTMDPLPPPMRAPVYHVSPSRHAAAPPPAHTSAMPSYSTYRPPPPPPVESPRRVQPPHVSPPRAAAPPPPPPPPLPESASPRDADDFIDAVRTQDAIRVHNILRRLPNILHVASGALHVACGAAAPHFDIIAAIVAARPELVNGVDTATGNTPLHLACAAASPSVEVVDVLLSRGASIAAFNKDGLTPFHVALLNSGDVGNRLKRFLLFKGSANINAPTAHGETPAHVVVISDRFLESLKFLVQHGGSVGTPALVLNGNNAPVSMTPLEKARMYGADECRRYLERLLLGNN